MDTPVSLLERLRKPAEAHAWERFVQLYTPLMYHWVRRMGCPEQDVADLVQDVFVALLQALPAFEYDRHKSFRRWLRTVALNKWRDRCRSEGKMRTGPMELADDPGAQDRDPFWEHEFRQHLVARALRVMQSDFQPATWKACWEHVVSGRSAQEVAAELHITVGAVYAAKVRVLDRLRQELAGMLD